MLTCPKCGCPYTQGSRGCCVTCYTLQFLEVRAHLILRRTA